MASFLDELFRNRLGNDNIIPQMRNDVIGRNYYKDAPADPMGTAENIIDPSGQMEQSPIGVLTNTLPPEGMADSVPLRSGDGVPLPLPAGMADSLAMRSGDDMAKPPLPPVINQSPDATEPVVPSAFRKEDMVDQAVRHKPIDERMPDQQLLDAQNRSNTLAALMMMGKGAEKIGSSIAHTQSDKNYLDEMKGMVNKPVEDVINQRKLASNDLSDQVSRYNFAFAKDKDDPESPTSSLYRQVIEKYQPTINVKGMSASEIEKVMPTITNLANSELARQAKLEQTNATATTKKETSDEKAKAKLVSDMGKDLNPDVGRAGNMGKYAMQAKQAERLSGLARDAATGGIQNLRADQQEELALGVARMLSGTGASSRSQVSALVPHTIMGEGKKLQQWWTNNPTGLNQQKFTEAMMKTIDREKDIATDQLKRAQVQNLSKYTKLREMDPEQYDAQLRAAGIVPEEDLDEKGMYISKTIDTKSKTPEKKIENNKTPKGFIDVRRKSDGVVSRLSSEKAAKVLADPMYEEAK